MISCAEIHKEMRYRLNSYNKSDNDNPEVTKIDAVVQRALRIWYRKRIRKAETNAEERELLQPFLVGDVELEIEKKGDRYIAKYPKDFFHKSHYRVLAKKEECAEAKGGCKKYLVPHPVQGDDFNFTIKDPDRKPSYEYESILYSEKTDGVHFYTNGEFEIENITLDYYKEIKPPQCPSRLVGVDYIKPDGTVVKRDIGLPDFRLNSEDDIYSIATILYLKRVNNKEELSNHLMLVKKEYEL